MPPITCVDCAYWFPDPDMSAGRCHCTYSDHWSRYTRPTTTCQFGAKQHEKSLDDRFEEACLTRR